jgi:hypothetical protein
MNSKKGDPDDFRLTDFYFNYSLCKSGDVSTITDNA